jgi:hypothetical protein
MRLENNVTSKNPHKTSRFTNCGVFLTGRKVIPPSPFIAEETRRHSAAAIGFNAGASHGFGAGENDWLGAEAYVDPLR